MTKALTRAAASRRLSSTQSKLVVASARRASSSL